MSDIYINMVDDNTEGKTLCFINNPGSNPMVAYKGVTLDLLGVIIKIRAQRYFTEKDVLDSNFWMDAVKEQYSDKNNHLGEFNEELALKVFRELII